jgi:hypothetical protein
MRGNREEAGGPQVGTQEVVVLFQPLDLEGVSCLQ